MAHVMTNKGLYVGLVVEKPIKKAEPVQIEPAKPVRPKSKKK